MEGKGKNEIVVGEPRDVFDRSGNKMTITYVNDFPCFDLRPFVKCELKEHFENIRDLTIRDDDIVICGYSKAGKGKNEIVVGEPRDVFDRSGNKMTIIDVNDFPSMDLRPLVNCELKEHFEKIRDLTIRDDDIVICGYSKAGTHWLWEVLSMLRNKTTEYKKEVKEKQMIEFLQKGDLDKEPSPRVLNTHLYPSLLPKQMLEKKTKLVYLIRNPKDTAVSLYFHFYGLQALTSYTGDMHDFVDLYLHGELEFGTWFEYVSKWEKFLQTVDNPVYILRYEDMKEKPVHHVKELSKFLEIDVSDNLIKDIVEACSFKNLKKATEEQKIDPFKEIWIKGNSMYRKGIVGDWKNYFTVAENEEFDKVYQEKMKDSKLQFTYT